jgi:hypothetical protein
MTTFRDIGGNKVAAQQLDHSPSTPAQSDKMPTEPGPGDRLPSQALVLYTPPTPLFELDAPAIEVTLPHLRPVQRANWPARLVGTGMVAATAASGLLLVDSMNQPQPVPPQDSALAKAKSPQPQGSKSQLPKPPIASPETLPEPFPSDLVPDEPALKPGTLQSRLTKLIKQGQSGAQSVKPLAPTTVAGTPRFSLNADFKLGKPVLRSVQELPTVAVSPTSVNPAPAAPAEPLAPPANVLSTLPPPPVVAAAMPTANSPTGGLQAHVMPASEAVVAQPTTAKEAQPISTTTPLPTAEPDGVQWVTTKPAKGSDQPQPAAVTGSAAAIGSVSSPSSGSVAGSTSAPSSMAQDIVFTAPSAVAASPNPSPALRSVANTPQSIQDFVQAQHSSPWLALTVQAAQEAAATNQVNGFRVFRIGLKDYQSIWRSSSVGTQVAAPAHGFVDYTQQVIILPQASTGVTTQPQPSPASQPSAQPAAVSPMQPVKPAAPISQPETMSVSPASVSTVTPVKGDLQVAPIAQQ